MISESLHGSNRLIRKTILRMFPGSFAATLTINIALMVDTLLAGGLIGQQAIAAVAIGAPAIGIFQALTQTIVHGAAVEIAIHAGRGHQDQIRKTFSLGMVTAVILGLGFLLVCLGLADGLAMAFGGAGNPAVAAQAALYLRASSVCIVMGSVNTLLSKIFALYGYQKAVFLSAFVAMAGNVVFSTLYINLLPAELAIAGLGMGTWSGGFLAVVVALTVIKVKKIPVSFSLKGLQLKGIPSLFRHGIASSGNNLADGMVSGVVNNIIVTGFGGDTLALSVYTAVKGVVTFAMASVQGTVLSAAPLFGILFGARDKNGIYRTVRESLKVGMLAWVCWSAVIYALSPLLAGFYGMQGNSYFFPGLLLSLLLLPLRLIVNTMAQLFESTGKTGMGMLYSIIPDSLIYPLVLAALLPPLGYTGIWIAYGANAVPFLAVLYLLFSARHKTFRLSMDRLLCLDRSIRDHVPMLDISIRSSNTDVTGISRQVHEFLLEQKASGRTAYMTALCLEELAADFVAHTLLSGEKTGEQTLMDIKVYSEEDTLDIIIRNAAKPYNPLVFELDENTFAKAGVKLAQKLSRRIDYNYVYKLNIVHIVVDK